MIENLIIGAGFSAHMAYEIMKKKKYSCMILSPKKSPIFLNGYNRNSLFSNNKILGKKSNSFTKIKYNIKKKVKIHDRVISGGNSSIWGGIINLNNLNYKSKEIFNELGIKFQKLNFQTTYSKSNIDNLAQLINSKGKIYDSSEFLKIDIDGFATRLNIENYKIRVNYINLSTNEEGHIYAKNVYLAVSFIQLIELLNYSQFLKNNSVLKIEEFDHAFKISFLKNFKFADKKNVNIKYNIIGAIKHMLGYQNKLNLFNKISGFIPMYVDQTFYKKKKTLILRYSENKICSSESFKFGDSIHYNNFQINNLHINRYLNSISKNLYCISMPASKQKLPGPISNDILNNITNILSYD